MAESYTQFKDRRYEAQGGLCALCERYVSREEIQAHHVFHRNVAPHLLMDDDNVPLLCPCCHDLDGQGHGRLRLRLIRKLGQEWFDRLSKKVVAHG